MNFVDNKTFTREVAMTGKPVTITCGDMSTMAKVTDVNVETMPGRHNDPSSTVTLKCELREVDTTSWVRHTNMGLARAVWEEEKLQYARALAKYSCSSSRTETFAIEKVIFNNPATIVFWMDGTKTVVKTQNGEVYDPEKGLAMAISKRALGDKGNYYDTFKKYIPDVEKETINEDDVAGVWMSLEDAKSITNAYKSLTKIMNETKVLKADMAAAIEEATGYLGEVLE
jgi:hypothetical protein